MRYKDPDGRDNWDVVWGYSIGLATNVIPGTGFLRDRYSPNDLSDYNNALQGVDNASIVVGSGMIDVGGTGMVIGGAAVTVGSGGAAAVAGTVLMTNGKQNQDAGYNRGKNSSRPKSMNQLQKDITKGKAPDGIKRFGTGKGYKEQDHVHFDDNKNSALNKDGTWNMEAWNL